MTAITQGPGYQQFGPIGWGNAKIEEAEVFIFPLENVRSKSGDLAHRFISENYRKKTDVVLAEGLEEDRYSSKLWTSSRGWKSRNYRELIKTSRTQKHEEMCAKISALKEKLRLECLDFKSLEAKLDDISSQVQDLIDYFDPQMGRAEDLIKECYNDQNSKKLIFKHDNFMEFVTDLVVRLRKNEEAAFYRHMTKEDAQLIKEKWSANGHIALQCQIQSFLSQGKRAFVKVGFMHVLGAPHLGYIPEDVQSYLLQHKFVIITDRTLLTEEIMKLNQNLFKTLHEVKLP